MPEILPNQNVSTTDSLGGVGGFAPVPGAGITAGAVATDTRTLSVTDTARGKNVNYTVTVVIPVPFLNLKIDSLVGAFILPIFSALGIPKALISLQSELSTIMNNVFADIQVLLRAIPEMTVSVVVKLGPVIVFNFLFMVQKVPVVVSPPSFQLALPNLAVNAALNIGITPLNPVIIRIPIPWPIYKPTPLLTLSGGSINATAGIVPTSGTPSSATTTRVAGTGGGAAAVGPSAVARGAAATLGAAAVNTQGQTATLGPTAVVGAGTPLPTNTVPTFIQMPLI